MIFLSRIYRQFTNVGSGRSEHSVRSTAASVSASLASRYLKGLVSSDVTSWQLCVVRACFAHKVSVQLLVQSIVIYTPFRTAWQNLGQRLGSKKSHDFILPWKEKTLKSCVNKFTIKTLRKSWRICIDSRVDLGRGWKWPVWAAMIDRPAARVLQNVCETSSTGSINKNLPGCNRTQQQGHTLAKHGKDKLLLHVLAGCQKRSGNAG